MIFQKKNLRMFLLDGRIGHSTYLMFFLTIVNFIIISFNFLFEGNTIFGNIVTNMWLFSIIFFVFYIPGSILIGRWHRYTQVSTDYTILIKSNTTLAMMIRILLDIKTGKATKEEILEVRNLMLDIEKKEKDSFR